MGRGSRAGESAAITVAPGLLRPRALAPQPAPFTDSLGQTALAAYQRDRLRPVTVTSAADARALVDRLRAGGVRDLGVDFECGFTSREWEVWTGSIRLVAVDVIDPADGLQRQFLFDLHADDMHAPVAELLADPRIEEKRLHHGRFEQEWAHVQLGVTIANVFDTHAAWQSVQKILGQRLKRKDGRALVDAILPGWERGKLSLAAVTLALLDLELPKGGQSDDWNLPLTDTARAYAATDVIVLRDLAPKLKQLVAALELDAEVAGKSAKIAASTVERWPAERLDRSGHGRRVCWELVHASTVAELDDVWRQARARPLSHPHREQLAAFYASRRLELAG